MTDTTEEDEALRSALAAANFDGPRRLPMAWSPFAVEQMYAVCLTCGAAVMLGDPMERSGASPVERGVYLHAEWHRGLRA